MFTVYGRVNSKGIRYEYIQIIAADNEDLASSIYKERVKHEFQGVRNITCVKVNSFKEGDIQETKEIALPEKVSKPEEKPGIIKVKINDETFEVSDKIPKEYIEYLVKLYAELKHHKHKLYVCYCTPRKKLKTNDYKNPMLYFGIDKEDAYSHCKSEFSKNGVPFKDKYVHDFHEITLRELIENQYIRNRLIDKDDFNTQYSMINLLNDKHNLVDMIKGEE